MPPPRLRITLRQLMLAVLVVAVLNGGLAWLAGQVRRIGRGTPEQIEARTWVFTLFVNLTVAALFLMVVVGKWLGAVRRHRLGLPEPAPPTLAKLRASALFNILVMTAISVSNVVSREGWNIFTERGLLNLASGDGHLIFGRAGRSRSPLCVPPSGTAPPRSQSEWGRNGGCRAPLPRPGNGRSARGAWP